MPQTRATEQIVHFEKLGDLWRANASDKTAIGFGRSKLMFI